MGTGPAAAAHPAPRRHRVTERALWAGLFGAPAAWSVHALVSTAVVGALCADRPRGGSHPATAWGVVLAVSVASLALAAATGWLALRNWRETGTRGEGERGEEHWLLEVGEGRARFMAYAGILLSAVFLFGIVMNALPLLLVPVCG